MLQGQLCELVCETSCLFKECPVVSQSKVNERLWLPPAIKEIFVVWRLKSLLMKVTVF
jgi:hypothetical protein